MPTYTYKCNDCEHVFDVRQGMTEDKLTDCPECKKEEVLERIITASAGFQLKGKGWFGNNAKNTSGY